uniref:Putative secreted protein n=1 Tax=Ixodes ricinus TaxID=34613 RepID=A0A6B0TTV8_IXORI
MQHQDLSILVAGWTSMFLLASTTRWTISSKTGNPFFSIFEKTRTPLISTSKEVLRPTIPWTWAPGTLARI